MNDKFHRDLKEELLVHYNNDLSRDLLKLGCAEDHQFTEKLGEEIENVFEMTCQVIKQHVAQNNQAVLLDALQSYTKKNSEYLDEQCVTMDSFVAKHGELVKQAEDYVTVHFQPTDKGRLEQSAKEEDVEQLRAQLRQKIEESFKMSCRFVELKQGGTSIEMLQKEIDDRKAREDAMKREIEQNKSEMEEKNKLAEEKFQEGLKSTEERLADELKKTVFPLLYRRHIHLFF